MSWTCVPRGALRHQLQSPEDGTQKYTTNSYPFPKFFYIKSDNTPLIIANQFELSYVINTAVL